MFQLLFMNEGEIVPYVKNVLPLLDESYDRILHSIMSDFSIKVLTELFLSLLKNAKEQS